MALYGFSTRPDTRCDVEAPVGFCRGSARGATIKHFEGTWTIIKGEKAWLDAKKKVGDEEETRKTPP